MNWTGKMAEYFTRNGRLSMILVPTLFLWGFISFSTIPRQYNPRITAPAFQVVVDFPGARRSEVLEQVTRPLENIVADIPGVEDIHSVTEGGGRAFVNVNFYVGRDFDSAKITLTDRINSRLNLAPLGISAPLIRSIDPDDVPVLVVALTSDKLDGIRLRKEAFRLRNRLTAIPGATNITVVGGLRRELSIRVDPTRLARSGIGLADIENALRRANIYRPSGLIKGEDRYIKVEAAGTIRGPDDLKNLTVLTGDFGRIQLKDVALIREGPGEIEEYVRHTRRAGNEKEAGVLVSIARGKNTNVTDLSRDTHERMQALKPDLEKLGIRASIIVDEGETAREEINRLMGNLVTAILIVVAILMLFLDRRGAILAAISIPLTLASVFGVAGLLGQGVNRITLFALILSLGLLVDNATVVIENIVRRLSAASASSADSPEASPNETGGEVGDEKSRVGIIVSAVAEVGPGLFMSTVTTVLAFVPMAFVTGMMGPYMGPIPFFVPAALILSLLLSLTLIPWMASRILKPTSTPSNGGSSSGLVAKLRAKLGFFSQAGKGLLAAFESFLRGVLESPGKRKLVLAAVLGGLMLSMLLPATALVKFRMLPKADRKQFFLYIDLPGGTPLEETFRVATMARKFLLKQKDVEMVQSYTGRAPILDFNGLFRGTDARREPRHATLRVGLTHPETRDRTSEEIVAGLRPKLLKAAASFSKKKIELKFVEDPPGPPVLSTLLVRVRGDDEKLLRETARKLLPRVSKLEGVVDVDTSDPADTETLRVDINPVRASRSRLDPARIAGALNSLYAGRIVGIYHHGENPEQEYITLRLVRGARQSPKVLERLSLNNALGIRVPLAGLVKIRKVKSEKPLRRENRMNTVYIVGEMDGRSITYAGIDLLKVLHGLKPAGAERTEFSLFGAKYKTPDGRVLDITIGGEWELTLEVFRDLGAAMGVAVFFIFVVLVAQFGTMRESLLVMLTIPLSLIGVLPGFMVLGFTKGLFFNATSMIGVIALAGIAVNNSIILLEYLNSLRREGMDIVDALVRAGVTRFRPIMLTTVTTILGSATIVGDPVWAGLAFAVILGLGVSSLLTLLVFPITYRMLMRV